MYNGRTHIFYGKIDFKQRLGYDVTDKAIKDFMGVLSDLAHYRDREFDSCDLIEQLFEKLPSEKVQSLITKLTDLYA